ncbi:uncharacterized protein FFB14_14681 [Fusarium fujikuroi]|nr:uncharacterized protein FFB14_14681 [Fusarium fujikuroi]
MGKVRVKEEG